MFDALLLPSLNDHTLHHDEQNNTDFTHCVLSVGNKSGLFDDALRVNLPGERLNRCATRTNLIGGPIAILPPLGFRHALSE